MLNCGVYTIENTTNGKLYVGSSVSLHTRFSRHRSQLMRGVHPSPILQNSWNKHGEDSFIFKTVLFCSRDNLLYYEQRAMDVLFPRYNIRKIAGSNLGIKFSEATKKKLSEAGKGLVHSEVSKKKISEARKGMVFSDAHRKSLSNSRRGVLLSEPHKRKISETMKRSWILRRSRETLCPPN